MHELFVRCNAQIVYHHRGTALKVKPSNPLPVDAFVGRTIVASKFECAAITNINTPVSFVGADGGIPKTESNTCCIRFDTRHSVTRCDFEFTELLGGNIGIRVDTPGQEASFAFNRIAAPFIHEQFNTSVMGTKDSDPGNLRIRANRWNIHCAPSKDACAMDIHGNHDRWTITTVAEKGPLNGLLKTHSTTTDNTFALQDAEGDIAGPFSKANPGSNRYE